MSVGEDAGVGQSGVEALDFLFTAKTEDGVQTTQLTMTGAMSLNSAKVGYSKVGFDAKLCLVFAVPHRNYANS